MLTKEGEFKFKITNGFMSENTKPNKFGVFDATLEMHRVDDPNESGYWSGELSDHPLGGSGNKSHMSWLEITLENLGKIGLTKMAKALEGKTQNEVYAQSIAITKALQSLVGQTIPATVTRWDKQNGTTEYQIKYIGHSDFAPKPVDPAKIIEMAKANPMATGAPAPAPAATVDDDPFNAGDDNPF